jgi:hypothetical protein
MQGHKQHTWRQNATASKGEWNAMMKLRSMACTQGRNCLHFGGDLQVQKGHA